VIHQRIMVVVHDGCAAVVDLGIDMITRDEGLVRGEGYIIKDLTDW